MNTEFNTIEKISNDATITNKSVAYLEACNQFEIEASKFANNENFVSRKSAEEVSLNLEKALTLYGFNDDFPNLIMKRMDLKLKQFMEIMRLIFSK